MTGPADTGLPPERGTAPAVAVEPSSGSRPYGAGDAIELVRAAWAVSRGLTLLTILNVFVLAGSIAGRLLDDTVLNGVSAWDKPAKFALSFLAFGPTLLWLFSRVEHTKLVKRGLGVLGWSMILEVTLIFLQSVRGTTSHFNHETTFDGAVYRTMAIGVGIFAVAGVLTGLALARRNLGSGPFALATKVAVMLMTAGAVLGFSMTRTMPGQTVGGDTIGSHTVGGPDGSHGLPFLGWSTEFGDLRVAHFLGLHSLQIVPLIALALVWLNRRQTFHLNDTGLRRVTALGSVAWVGIVATTFIEALRGLPVTTPDTTTWVSFAVLAAVPALVALVLAINPPVRLSNRP